jgi:hypothetical protein
MIAKKTSIMYYVPHASCEVKAAGKEGSKANEQSKSV